MLVQHFLVFLVVSAMMLLGADTARERFDAGVRAQKAGDLRSAVVAYREALAENPQLAVARHLLAVCELQLGNVSEGMRQLELVLRADPANRQAAYTLVSTYIAAGRLEQARAVLEGLL